MTRRLSWFVLTALASSALATAASAQQAGPRTEAEILAGDEGDDLVDQDVRSETRREGTENVRSMHFQHGLDIDGDRRGLTMMYFVTRLRAEFESPRLRHRSFIPELQRSSHGRSLRGGP